MVKFTSVGINERFKLATWSVQSIITKEEELCSELKERNINTSIITEKVNTKILRADCCRCISHKEYAQLKTD